MPDSTAIVTSARRHEGWDLDLAADLYVVRLDGEVRPLTRQTGDYSHPSVSPDGSLVALLGMDDPQVDPQNAAVGVIGIDGGDITWISTALDRNWRPYPLARQPVWTDVDTLLATVEDRGETHIYELAADGSRTPQALTKGPLGVQGFDAVAGVVAMAESTGCSAPPSCAHSTARSRR